LVVPDKQRTFGQFETPADVADLVLAFCLRRPGERVLDPSCGNGALLQRAAAWQTWLSDADVPDTSTLWGVELEADAVALARRRLPDAHILHQNFFTLVPDEPFDAIVGNPPFTRAEWFGRLRRHAASQMRMFGRDDGGVGTAKEPVIPGHLWRQGLSRRAGLHTYFFLHGARFLREGGRFGFVMPNNWLDVAYAHELKQFLLDQFKLLAFIESTVERWFDSARVNTCLVILEKCSDPMARAGHLVRFVQLRDPLRQLVGYPPEDRAHFSQVESLVTRLLPAQDRTTASARVRVVPQDTLQAREKWGIVWRGPALMRQVQQHAARRHLAPLSRWARVQRGFTTGANAFFYLDETAQARWEIEAPFRQPLLKSLRRVDRLQLTRADCFHDVLCVPPTAALAGSNVAAYIAWGEARGYHERRTCQSRTPWYVLPAQQPAPLVLPKGIWGRFFVPLLEDPVCVDQQLYQLHLAPAVSPLAAAALLNSAWLALQLELLGRGNFGEGVLWLAGYEVEHVLLPDPRYLEVSQIATLEEHFTALAAQPVHADFATEMARPARQALDRYVFGLMGFSETEAIVALDALRDSVESRQQRANSARAA
jgi:hypothetical protein